MTDSNFKNILSSFTFPVSKIKLNSRTVMAPMTTYSGNEDGVAKNKIYYAKRNLNNAIKDKTGIDDFIEGSTMQFNINPKYLKVDE